MGMVTVTAIRRIDRPPYSEKLISGGLEGSPRTLEERVAPVEAFYLIEVFADGRRQTFEAEIRRAPRDALQLDWSDSLQDLLANHKCSRADRDSLGAAIVDAHDGGFGKLPLHLGEPAV